MTLQGVNKRKVVAVSDFRFTGRVLGKGNFARVEEAVHTVLHVKVAVKIIDIGQIKEKYIVKNLHREARVMSMLNHPCIAALFQTLQMADNVYYLVTELVAGGDLCSFIIGQRYGKLEERPARIYARQFVSALSHMHSFGVVHRDLKMENVMLNATRTQIKIVDFGLSNVWTDDNPLKTHCGSPEYAAPELFVAGKEYGPEVDLWSLGIILYGMVVGQLPFVSMKSNQVSSQERRKKLVAQINKGLGLFHRRAISTMSLEFRAMLNKLLVPDAIKRINIKDLSAHPWITEKGRKIVQVHPIKRLDTPWQSKLTKQISDLYGIDQHKVVTEICKDPYGKFGGIYNILVFKYFTEQLSPDCVVNARILPHSLNFEKTLTKPKSAPPNKTHNIYNQCVVLLHKISTTQTAPPDRAKTANPSLTKNFAKTIHQTPMNQTYSKLDEVAVTRNPKEVPSAPIPLRKAMSSRIVIDDRRRTRSDSAAAVKRPNSKLRTRNSVSSATAEAGELNNQRSLRGVQWETNLAEMGDGPKGKKDFGHVTWARIKATDPLANDPIARSIAGYVGKNVPDKIFSLRKVRKQFPDTWK